jgi:hypothetical protein
MKVSTFLYPLLSAAILVLANDGALQARDTAVIDQAYSAASIAFADLTIAVKNYRLNPSRDTTNQQIGIDNKADRAVSILRDGTLKVQRSPSILASEATRVARRVEVFLNDIENVLSAFSSARETIIRSGGKARAKTMLQDLQRGSHALAEAVSMKTPGGGAVGSTFIARGRSMYDRAIMMF